MYDIALLVFLVVLAGIACAPRFVEYFNAIMNDSVGDIVDFDRPPTRPPAR